MSFTTHTLRLTAVHLGLAFAVASIPLTSSVPSFAQAPAAAPARATPQRGTVKAIAGSNLTVTTDAGQQMTIAVSPSARIQRLAPGSTDLKTAEASTLDDIAVGDRILVTGAQGDTPDSFTAARVILMKSGDIAQKHEAEQQDWQKRGTGGIVTAIDSTSSALTISAGARKLTISTSPTTTFRRYAGGSVKFEDAKPGTLAQIQVGDQLRARGAKSDDGTSVAAEEVVSGSFKNLSGTIVSVDAANNTISLKDLVTKRNVTVQLTPNSALHKLAPQQAATLASRARGGAPAGAGGAHPAAGQPSTTPASRPVGDASAAGGGRPAGMGHGGEGGGDLSQMVARSPTVSLSDLHTGDAVMVVAEQSSTEGSALAAITLLAGVEPILAAAPAGSAATTLSPWSVGTGAPEGGGQQ